MAYHFDSYDNSLVVDGFAKGIADNPYDGIADMRNVNIVSVPGEASVNFATSKISSPTVATVTVTGVSSNVLSFASTSGLEDGMAIQFTNLGSLGTVALNTTYYLWAVTATSAKLDPQWIRIGAPSTQTITGSAGGATFSVMTVNQPKHFTYTGTKYYMIDASGQTWTNQLVTGTNSYWTYTGLTGTSDTKHGNGLCYYQATSAATGNGFVFAFNDGSIDYFNTVTGVWVWGWKPSTGATSQAAGYLHLNTGSPSHEAQVAPDNVFYFCDGNWIGNFFEKSSQVFDPTNTATYTAQQFSALIPTTDVAQCLGYLGSTILAGGMNNIIYSFTPGVNTSISGQPLANWIQLAEFNVHRLVTVNTTTYIFVGNRGRIYYTNGTNVQLYKKVPDHISGTVEPYFTWGGACSIKNQLYFSVSATTNAGVVLSQYGGMWAVDVDTTAIRLTNKLSYGTYAGSATAMIPNFGTSPAGTGLYIGWDDSTSHYGIDQTTSAPYTGSQATIDSDLIPIGTFEKPRDFTQLEYRLVRPLVAGESVTIKTRLIFNTSDTGYSTGALIDSTAGNYSNVGNIDFKNAQWVQFQIVLNSTASSPSYTRLKEIRIKGLVGPTLSTSQQLGL